MIWIRQLGPFFLELIPKLSQLREGKQKDPNALAFNLMCTGASFCIVWGENSKKNNSNCKPQGFV